MSTTMPRARSAALCLWVYCVSGAAAQATGDPKTVRQLQQEAAEGQASQAQPAASDSKLRLSVAAPKPRSCPDPDALGIFKHEIAYDRTEELDPLKALSLIHVHVWERGSSTAFYVDERLQTYVANTRVMYFVGTDGSRGYATCPAAEDWQKCVADSAGLDGANNVVLTCTAAIDLRSIPAWEPSPNDRTKRQLSSELLSEIEAKWPGVLEVVIRDFNLQDRQITMYLKMPDGDYYQGCGFRAMREPHCESWHLFGMAPASGVRKWIFEKPYRLK